MKVTDRFSIGKLYCTSKNGQLRSFKIICRKYSNGNALMVTRKRVEPAGKITRDKYLYMEGKNLGKANETTPWQQCKNEAVSMANRLRDKGYGDKPDPTKPKEEWERPEPMLAIKWDESKIKFPCMIQPKLDGVRCIMYKDKSKEGGEVHLMSRRGKELNIPHIKAYLEKNPHLLPLDGELYNHDSLSFQGIISAVKRLSKATDKIQIVVYDKPLKGYTNKQRQMALNLHIYQLQMTKAPIRVLETYRCDNMADIEKYHKQFTSKGYEGSIIRNMDGQYEFGYRSNNLIKKKDFIDEEFPILDVQEASGRDAGTAIFVLRAKNGHAFNARPQGSKELRTQYLRDRKKLIGKQCTVKYQELSDYGIPRFPSAIAVRDYE